MRSITKVFFLGALFALVALAPNGAGAETVNVVRIEVSPQTVQVLTTKEENITFMISAFNNTGGPEKVNDTLKELAWYVDKQIGSVIVPKLTDVSTFQINYKKDAGKGTDGEVETLTLTLFEGGDQSKKKDDTKATITFLSGFSAGQPCNPNATPSECYTGNTCDALRGLCIPNVDKRKIGTYCTDANDCSLGSGTLTLTCDESNTACVGATNNVLCGPNDVNNDAHYGKIGDALSSEMRCDTGLVCDAEELKCVNDFGQGEIPGDKLGEAATDLRDQIRELINIALGFLGVIGVIVTLYGGFTWMTAFGDDEKVGKAKKTLVAGIIGIVIIGIAWTIVSYVLNLAGEIA